MQYIKMSSTSQLEQMSDEKSTVEEKEKSRLCWEKGKELIGSI